MLTGKVYKHIIFSVVTYAEKYYISNCMISCNIANCYSCQRTLSRLCIGSLKHVYYRYAQSLTKKDNLILINVFDSVDGG